MGRMPILWRCPVAAAHVSWRYAFKSSLSGEIHANISADYTLILCQRLMIAAHVPQRCAARSSCYKAKSMLVSQRNHTFNLYRNLVIAAHMPWRCAVELAFFYGGVHASISVDHASILCRRLRVVAHALWRYTIKTTCYMAKSTLVSQRITH